MEPLTAFVALLVTMTALVLVAAWPPRPWLVAVVIAGPAVAVLALLEVTPFDLLGWLPVLGVGYLHLLVPPLVPWRRPWARLAVPGTVLAICLTLAALGGVPVATYLLLPLLASAVAVLASTSSAVVGWREQRGTSPTAPRSSAGS